jgi:hypothetical protein
MSSCEAPAIFFRQWLTNVIGTDETAVQARVAADCAAAVPLLERRVGTWLKLHAIAPRKISLSRKTDGGESEQFWLVTDHTGSDDSSFRLVYDDVVGQYGIECAILNSISLFIGFRASLLEAITDIKFVR